MKFFFYLFLIIYFATATDNNCEEGFCSFEKEKEDQQKEESMLRKMTFIETAGNAFSRIKRGAMAWRSTGSSNSELIDNLQRHGMFSDERVKNAMLSVDRGDFAPRTPYGDHPVSIGYSATISAPHMHASALERLKDHLKEGDRALDVGSGSGYLTACMALMVGKTGKVIGVEHIDELVELSKENVNKHHEDLLTSGRIEFFAGDGRQGYKPAAPYKAIHVGAAAPKIPPALLEQLAPGGRMLIPVGGQYGGQEFVQVDKDTNGEIKRTNLMGVIYVPLTDKEKQVGPALGS